MKYCYLLLLCIMDAYWLGLCALKRKNTEHTSSEYNETIAEYEKQHYNNWSTSTSHNKWSEVEIGMSAEICQQYLRKMFPIRDLSLKSYHIIDGLLRYNYFQAAVTVTTLACELFRPVNSRSYFHFIKAPNPGCLYVINRQKGKTIKNFNIAFEVCDFNTHKDLKKSGNMEKGIFKMKNNLKRGKKYRCTEQRKHEFNHLIDYSRDKNKYETWPELEEKILNEYCQFLLRKTFPKTHFQGIISECKPLVLRYQRIKHEDDLNYHDRSVAALLCIVTKGSINHRKKQYQFIRAPGSNHSICAFLTNSVRGFPSCFSIIKLICDQGTTRNVSKETELLMGDSNNVGRAAGTGSASNNE